MLCYFVQLRIAKVKPSRKVPLISTYTILRFPIQFLKHFVEFFFIIIQFTEIKITKRYLCCIHFSISHSFYTVSKISADCLHYNRYIKFCFLICIGTQVMFTVSAKFSKRYLLVP